MKDYSKSVIQMFPLFRYLLSRSPLYRGHKSFFQIVLQTFSPELNLIFCLFFSQEAIESVCLYFHPSTMDQFVETVINSVLEKSESARKKTAHFLSQLVKKRVLLKKQYQTGLQTILEVVPDLVVDIPKVWVYLAELIGK